MGETINSISAYDKKSPGLAMLIIYTYVEKHSGNLSSFVTLN